MGIRKLFILRCNYTGYLYKREDIVYRSRKYRCIVYQIYNYAFAGMTIFRGFMRVIVLIILFYIPEWDFLVAPFIRGPANYFRKIFWDSMNTREKLAFKKGDMIDSMLALKNGEQNPIYSKDHI